MALQNYKINNEEATKVATEALKTFIIEMSKRPELALQGISIDVYNSKTKKVTKLDLFKEFENWIKEMNKGNSNAK